MSFAKNFIDVFINSTINTFKIQVGMEIKTGKPYVATQETLPKSDISGIIGIVSTEFSGTLSIMFSEKCFVGIVSKLLMEKHEKITSENESAAGELANIILGGAKKVLNEQEGHSLQYAIPSIITGSNHIIKSIREGGESFVVPLITEFGEFYIKISIEKK